MSDEGYVWHWVRHNGYDDPWSPVRVWHERVGDKRVLNTATDDDENITEWGPRIYEPGEAVPEPGPVELPEGWRRDASGTCRHAMMELSVDDDGDVIFRRSDTRQWWAIPASVLRALLRDHAPMRDAFCSPDASVEGLSFRNEELLRDRERMSQSMLKGLRDAIETKAEVDRLQARLAETESMRASLAVDFHARGDERDRLAARVAELEAARGT